MVDLKDLQDTGKTKGLYKHPELHRKCINLRVTSKTMSNNKVANHKFNQNKKKILTEIFPYREIYTVPLWTLEGNNFF